jgi:hypothetical protein
MKHSFSPCVNVNHLAPLVCAADYTPHDQQRFRPSSRVVLGAKAPKKIKERAEKRFEIST